MLPTAIKYYLDESLRHIVPCLGTFQHYCILKAILVRKLAFHHHLCSIDDPVIQSLPFQNVHMHTCVVVKPPITVI